MSHLISPLIHRLGVKICRFAHGNCDCSNRPRLCISIEKQANEFVTLVKDSLNNHPEDSAIEKGHQSYPERSFDVV